MTTPATAAEIIARLALAPHPEGGWYRETWRADAAPGERAAGTAIHFLLEPGRRSHWHRVDATELWLFQAGAPLTLRTALGERGEAGVVETVLGADVLAGQQVQAAVRSLTLGGRRRGQLGVRPKGLSHPRDAYARWPWSQLTSRRNSG